MDISTLRDQFLDHSTYIRGFSPKTTQRYRMVITLLCRSGGVSQIEACTEESVRGFFFRGRAERHWSASTFLTYHKSLAVFFRWCVGQGHLEKNPVEGIERPRLTRSLPRRLTRQESLRLLEVIHNYPYGDEFQRRRNHAIFATLLFAGLRQQELLHLQLTDVDVQNQSILVRCGKGNKDRLVPMTAALAGILRRYLEERHQKGRICPEVFTALHRDAPLSTEGMKRLVKFARKVSGLDFGTHRLRHTFATLMLEGGCDLFSLSKMMGHEDIKTTTIYLGASAAHLRAQMTKHPLNSVQRDITD